MRRRCFPLACIAWAGALGLWSCAERAPEHPHVVILLADDLGWADVGYHARGDGDALTTRAIDSLARSGLALERYYTAPMCTPARAGLMTGRSPLRAGLLRNLTVQDEVGLSLDEELMPEHFRRAGYSTAMVGKWHLGHARAEQQPTARGFDHFYGHLTGWIDYMTHERDGVLDWQRDGVELREEGYSTRLMAAAAMRAIRERDRSRPLYLYVAFNAPHTPLHVPPGAELGATEGELPARAAYRLMVAELDRAVGDILRTLETEGLVRDTLVVFASDNGAHPGYGGSNVPLREGKYSVFEGGIRVPAVLAWPGHLAPGRSDVIVSHMDLLPTLARAAGVSFTPKHALDGRDMWDVLRGTAPPPSRVLCFGAERADELRYGVLDGPWKLVELTEKSTGASRDLCFQVESDASETRDLAREDPARVAGLKSSLESWKSLPRLPFASIKER